MLNGDVPAFHGSWPREERRLIEKAIERHGGRSTWKRIDSVTARLISIDGFLLRVKRARACFETPRSITIAPKQARLITADYPEPGSTGVYSRGDVRLESGSRVVLESRDHRSKFGGVVRSFARWSALDALYFFGYALTSYATFPFVFPSLRFVQATPGSWRGERLEGVTVEFPASSQVHSLVQTFYFDRSGLIRRNDYHAEVAGLIWRGAHGWDDIVTVEGVPLPMTRTVVPRLGTLCAPWFPPAVRVRCDSFSVTANAIAV